MQSPLLPRLLLPLLLLRPRKTEMRDQLASRAHADAAVAVVVEETNQLRIQHLLQLSRPRNQLRLRSRRRVKLQAPRLDPPAFVSLAQKRSTSFVELLNLW